ncbi:HNH endonuclease [Pseudanabaena sp. UWO311]|nr:HNH endonuclease signature motif containing protein [Pseudanabaena sp. UWO311]TYQ29443.1 HNH endonuclease [Pseudanabaena sp. UWO311]
MNRKLYPPDWNAIAFEVKQKAHWICQKCEKQCLRPDEVAEAHKDWAIHTLTVHHIDHVPMNCDRKNLIALCSVCHRRQHAHDKKFGITTHQPSLFQL